MAEILSGLFTLSPRVKTIEMSSLNVKNGKYLRSTFPRLFRFTMIGEKMANRDLVKYHIWEALYASVLEKAGAGPLCHRLKADIKLRFMNMSNEELWELAITTSAPPENPVDKVYQNYKQAREKLKATSAERTKYLEEDV